MLPNRQPIATEICPRCTSDVTSAFAKGDSKCPYCGARLNNRLVNGTSRTGLWAFFWVVFLGAPAFFFLTANPEGMPSFAPLIIGAVVSGLILSLLVSHSALAVVPRALLFIMGVSAVYLGILFVGCLVVVSQKH